MQTYIMQKPQAKQITFLTKQHSIFLQSRGAAQFLHVPCSLDRDWPQFINRFGKFITYLAVFPHWTSNFRSDSAGKTKISFLPDERCSSGLGRKSSLLFWTLATSVSLRNPAASPCPWAVFSMQSARLLTPLGLPGFSSAAESVPYPLVPEASFPKYSRCRSAAFGWLSASLDLSWLTMHSFSSKISERIPIWLCSGEEASGSLAGELLLLPAPQLLVCDCTNCLISSWISYRKRKGKIPVRWHHKWHLNFDASSTHVISERIWVLIANNSSFQRVDVSCRSVHTGHNSTLCMVTVLSSMQWITGLQRHLLM